MKNNTREYNIYDMAEGTLFVYDIENDTLEIIKDYPMNGTHHISAVISEEDMVDVSGDPDHETWIMRAVSKLANLIIKEIMEEALEHFVNMPDECEDEKNEEDVLADIADLLLDVEDEENELMERDILIQTKRMGDIEENKSNNQLHPEHYNRGLEVIDFTNLYNLNGNEFNIVKYLLRYPFKGTPIEDLNKALNYTNFEIRRLTNHESIMIEANRMFRVKDMTDEQYYFTHDFLMSWKPYFKESEWGFVSNIINNIESIHSEELTIYDRVDVLYNIQNDIGDLIEVVKNND